MNRKFLKTLQSLTGILFFCLLLTFPVLSQTDPNPNSPTPVLLSASDSTRALAVRETGKSLKRKLPKAANQRL